MSESKTEVRETSADIKKKIEQMKEEMKNSAQPLNGMKANEVNANSQSADISIPEAKELKEGHKPDPVSPQAAKGVESSKPTDSGSQVDLKDWAKKRGIDWTTEESILVALRKSDQEFHKRQAEKKVADAAKPPYIPPAGNSPTTQYQPQVYANPSVPQFNQQPFNQQVLINQVAKDYQLTPEDADKLLRFNRDFYNLAIGQERQRYQTEIDSIKRENMKNSVFRELSSDPVFKRPDVAYEFHRVLEDMQDKNPEAFEQDPATYKRAYDITLQNIGRRVLEGQQLLEGQPPSISNSYLTPPLNPPQPLGKGSGGGSEENENFIDPVSFAKLSLAEKTKVLERMGLKAS